LHGSLATINDVGKTEKNDKVKRKKERKKKDREQRNF
jgi:hypothetical protein